MGSSALLDRAQDPHLRGHLCWRFGSQDEFVGQAREFLAEGLAEGQRVLYVGRGDLDVLVRQLCTVRALEDGIGRGAVQVASLEATYSSGAVVEPEEQVRRYATATGEALAAGFTGLRVAADATPMVRTPAQLDAFARYEYLVDRFMSTEPMSAMCAYSAAELDDESIAQLACLHPCASEGSTPFHLHAGSAGVSASLTGQLDVEARELWPLALERADLRPVDGRVVIDASRLEFIDHRSLLALADYAKQRDMTVVLRTSLSGPAHLLELLNVIAVRVEQM
jgi:anti-anti-sigma regulatory factor